MYHSPVLLDETIESLEINENGVYVDLTFGGGGHSKEILKRLSSKGKLIAFDSDNDAAENHIDDSRFTFLRQNFIYLMQNLNFLKIMDDDIKNQLKNKKKLAKEEKNTRTEINTFIEEIKD